MKDMRERWNLIDFFSPLSGAPKSGNSQLPADRGHVHHSRPIHTEARCRSLYLFQTVSYGSTAPEDSGGLGGFPTRTGQLQKAR